METEVVAKSIYRHGAPNIMGISQADREILID